MSPSEVGHGVCGREGMAELRPLGGGEEPVGHGVPARAVLDGDDAGHAGGRVKVKGGGCCVAAGVLGRWLTGGAERRGDGVENGDEKGVEAFESAPKPHVALIAEEDGGSPVVVLASEEHSASLLPLPLLPLPRRLGTRRLEDAPSPSPPASPRACPLASPPAALPASLPA